MGWECWRTSLCECSTRKSDQQNMMEIYSSCYLCTSPLSPHNTLYISVKKKKTWFHWCNSNLSGKKINPEVVMLILAIPHWGNSTWLMIDYNRKLANDDWQRRNFEQVNLAIKCKPTLNTKWGTKRPNNTKQSLQSCSFIWCIIWNNVFGLATFTVVFKHTENSRFIKTQPNKFIKMCNRL